MVARPARGHTPSRELDNGQRDERIRRRGCAGSQEAPRGDRSRDPWRHRRGRSRVGARRNRRRARRTHRRNAARPAARRRLRAGRAGGGETAAPGALRHRPQQLLERPAVSRREPRRRRRRRARQEQGVRPRAGDPAQPPRRRAAAAELNRIPIDHTGNAKMSPATVNAMPAPADLERLGALSRAGADRLSMTLAELATLLGGAAAAGQEMPDVRFPVRQLKAGEALYRAGDRFDAIYVVRSGFLKTVTVDLTGAEQVLAFPMGGDVIGLDGLDAERYASDAVALDSSQVAVVSFARIARLGHEHPLLERLLYAAFSRELIRKRNMIWLLGTLHAEARLATFLLDLSERFGRLGYSRSSFALRMSREEMGSYLGIKLETVSRAFSAFAAAGLLTVDRKEVTLTDIAGLQRVVRPQEEVSAGTAQTVRRATAPSTA